MQFLDSHFHLDLTPEPVRTLSQLQRAGHQVIAVTNAPSVFLATATLAAPAEGVHAALGLHPELVATHGNELPLMWQLFERTRFIGEIGLDYVTTDDVIRNQQRKVFEEIVSRCDKSGDKILTVHSRRSARDVVGIIGGGFRGKVILHWYSGSLRELKLAEEYGFYFSVNPAMCLSEGGLKLVHAMNPSRVLTETDGPFVSVNKRPAMAEDLIAVVTTLGNIWKCQPAEANQRIFDNWSAVLVG
jgi:TatD DNase family protein